MKKKVFKIIAITLVCLAAVMLIWSLVNPATVCIGGRTETLSFSEAWYLRFLLTMKETNFYEYGCGYSEDYAIQIDGLTYCLAKDDCNTVYIKELDFYYVIFEDNHKRLHEILS